ncbi:hypothetical protein J437_LFUL018708 [Ladona fulva]|uniref:Rho-GAP domain-containing protein n=1 Tax=Ladona fulva TaxID=123851 RepID=A0A8K0KPF3_LADFU|nr:hypothetical protein J437_LFUL018708 [Ladona fulva]
MWVNSYGLHAFTTGRRHIPSSKSRPKGSSQTLKQPGKLNLKDFSLVTDAIARMNVGGKEGMAQKLSKPGFGHAPLATPENVDLGSEYAQVKDAVPGSYPTYDGDYSYTLVQDAVSSSNKSKLRHRREKGPYSDSDSDWSSLERRQRGLDTYSKVNRKPTPHKRIRKKRTAIPVATPRVPPIQPFAAADGPGLLSYRFKEERSRGGCDSSEKAKLKMDASYGVVHDDESSLDVSSPRDVNSPMFGVVPKIKDGDKTTRRKEKQKAKEDEKQEKRRLKEEKLKRLAEKEKEREKKKQKQKVKSATVPQPLTLEDFVQSEDNSIPLLLEKCVRFIEEEGLDSEGIYRVPGNRAHVELLFQKFDEDPTFNIHDLDIPVNAVATALKDFFSKRLPPLLTQEIMAELEDISVKTDRSCRLLALRGLLKKLPRVHFEVLKFIFQHFVKISENCKLNSMDSKNLAICWWPTLLPIEFSDMGRFEQMRPHLEDVVQTMIDQYPFLFCGKEAFVMV